jgi:hypothetical protein
VLNVPGVVRVDALSRGADGGGEFILIGMLKSSGQAQITTADGSVLQQVTLDAGATQSFSFSKANAQATIQLFDGREIVTLTITGDGSTFFGQALVGS